MAENDDKPTTTEAVLIAQALSQIGWLINSAYFGLNEAFVRVIGNIPEADRWVIPAIIYALTTIPGVLIEAKAYKEKGYSINTAGSWIFGETNNVPLALLGSQVYGWLSNPTIIPAVVRCGIQQENTIAAAHIATVSLLGIFYTAVNLGIINDNNGLMMKGTNFIRTSIEEPIQKLAIKNVPDNLWSTAAYMGNWI